MLKSYSLNSLGETYRLRVTPAIDRTKGGIRAFTIRAGEISCTHLAEVDGVGSC
jgi:hypothetical protein